MSQGIRAKGENDMTRTIEIALSDMMSGGVPGVSTSYRFGMPSVCCSCGSTQEIQARGLYVEYEISHNHKFSLDFPLCSSCIKARETVAKAQRPAFPIGLAIAVVVVYVPILFLIKGIDQTGFICLVGPIVSLVIAWLISRAIRPYFDRKIDMHIHEASEKASKAVVIADYNSGGLFSKYDPKITFTFANDSFATLFAQMNQK
jgi:hypothetical protein